MKAKLIKENYNYEDDTFSSSDDTYVGFTIDEYGSVLYAYSSEGHHGKIEVDLADILEYFNLADENDISDEMINAYADKMLDSSDAEWEEDEGENPDEIRDYYYDR